MGKEVYEDFLLDFQKSKKANNTIDYIAKNMTPNTIKKIVLNDRIYYLRKEMSTTGISKENIPVQLYYIENKESEEEILRKIQENKQETYDLMELKSIQIRPSIVGDGKGTGKNITTFRDFFGENFSDIKKIEDLIKNEPVIEVFLETTEEIKETPKLPSGYYKKIEIPTQNENQQKVLRTYYLAHVPIDTDIETFFYKSKINKEKTIITADKLIDSEDFRKAVYLKTRPVLFYIDSTLDKKASISGSNCYVLDEDKDIYKNILLNLKNEKEKPVTECLLAYIACAANESEGNKIPELKKLREKIDEIIAGEKVTLDEFLNSKNLSHTLDVNKRKEVDWDKTFEESLRFIYWNSGIEKGQEIIDENKGIFYDVLENTLGLRGKEITDTINGIIEYYDDIKNELSNEIKDKNNIDFIKIYWKYKELRETLEQTNKTENQKANARIEFETDLFLGNIKFPKEYQYKIYKKFEEIKADYSQDIILDIVKNRESITYLEDDNLKILRKFYKELKEKNNLPDEIIDYYLKSALTNLGENSVLKNNENYINKYISYKILPIEEKLSMLIIKNNTSKDIPEKTICKGDIYILKEIYNFDNGKSELHLYIKTEDGYIDELITPDKDFDNSQEILRLIDIFKDDEKNFENIKKEYNKYFQGAIRESLNAETIEKISINEDLIASLSSILKDKSIVFVERSQEDIKNIRIITLQENAQISKDKKENILKSFVFIEDEEGTKSLNKNLNSIEALEQYIKEISQSSNIIPIIMPTTECQRIKELCEKESSSKLDKLRQLLDGETYKEIDKRSKLKQNLIKEASNLEKKKIGQVNKETKEQVNTGKLSRKQIDKSLFDGKYISIYDYSEDGLSKESLRILKRDKETGLVHELKITSSTGMSLMKMPLDKKSFSENFFVECKTLTGKELNKIIETNTGQKTFIKELSPTIVFQSDIINNVWNHSANQITLWTPDEGKNKMEILDLFVRTGINKKKEMSIENEIEYKFIEKEIRGTDRKERHFFRFEKIIKDEPFDELDENESKASNIYNITWINENGLFKSNKILENIIIEDGKIKITKDTRILSPGEEPYTELTGIKEEIVHLQKILDMNALNIETMTTAIKTNGIDISMQSFEIDSMFKFNNFTSDLLNSIIIMKDIPSKDSNLETLFSKEYVEQDKVQNVLIAFLEQDMHINRGDIDIDVNPKNLELLDDIKEEIQKSKASGEDCSFRDIIRKVVIKQNPDVESIEEVTNEIVRNLEEKISKELEIIKIEKDKSITDLLEILPNLELYQQTLENCFETCFTSKKKEALVVEENFLKEIQNDNLEEISEQLFEEKNYIKLEHIKDLLTAVIAEEIVYTYKDDKNNSSKTVGDARTLISKITEQESQNRASIEPGKKLISFLEAYEEKEIEKLNSMTKDSIKWRIDELKKENIFAGNNVKYLENPRTHSVELEITTQECPIRIKIKYFEEEQDIPGLVENNISSIKIENKEEIIEKLGLNEEQIDRIEKNLVPEIIKEIDSPQEGKYESDKLKDINPKEEITKKTNIKEENKKERIPLSEEKINKIMERLKTIEKKINDKSIPENKISYTEHSITID